MTTKSPSNKIMPRSARRSRKPLQDNWIKGPGRGISVKCTYTKCSFEWQYFGQHKWAECPICHSVMRVATAKRNFIDYSRSNPKVSRKAKPNEEREKERYNSNRMNINE
jgi:hypothetical protein